MGNHPEDTHRQGYRFRAGVPAEVRAGERTIACEAQNISRSGVLLVGDFEAPATDMMDFALKAPTGTLKIQLSGRVIRVEPNPEGQGLHVALEFVDLDPSQRDAIEVLLARILETPAAGPFDALKPGAPPQEIRKALDAIPLAQRVALSSRAGVKEREYLRTDIHPMVLEALAHNPALSVVEARLIAASPYLLSGTLDLLSNDPRFKGDEDMRMAIAVHPRVSLSTAERVTADLKVPQIRALLAKPGLNQILREKLFRRTTRR